MLFEEYAHWLLEGMDVSFPYKYFRSARWIGGHEAFDGLLLSNNVAVLMEYKGGFLARKARYSVSVSDFASDMSKKFQVGCRQLASGIHSVWGDDPRIRKRLQGIPVDHITAIVPVLVLQDHILRAPLLNWYLNQIFQEELQKYKLSPGT